MFLQALYQYAQRHRLLENLPLQKRRIHALIAIDGDGNLRFDHLIPLIDQDSKGKGRRGQERQMPRFPGENNGGKAYFLAENCTTVLGRQYEEDTKKGIAPGDSILSDPKKGGNPTKAYIHFWEQVIQAYRSTEDMRLKAMLSFKDRYLIERNGKIEGELPFIEMRSSSKKGHTELVARTNNGEFLPMKGVTLGFSIAGEPFTMESHTDPIRAYWFDRYSSESFNGDDSETMNTVPSDLSVCLITGEVGLPIARSHKPKILRVPRLSSGGYIVSFAKEAPAFSSYGNEMGQNAPVSESAAASYALAINELLDREDNHITIGPVSICFWSKLTDEIPGRIKSLLNRAYPEQVKRFLLSPFSGDSDKEVLRRERLYTVALTGNAGRVVVHHWLEQTLDDATTNFKRWWDDLLITNFYPTGKVEEGSNRPASPFAIQNLACSTLRKTKKQKDDKLLPARIVQLYRVALEGTSLPITMLKPILDEFHNALVKDDEKTRTFPYSQSRFALIKLILIRNRKEEDFMPEYELADTNDAAYNLGRLLAVLEGLQKRSRRTGKEGPERSADQINAGIIDRYYGQASTAPALMFPYLLSLSRHHLSKMKKGNEKDKNAARAIEQTMMAICMKFKAKPEEPGEPPKFPRLLNLEHQGRFALGFYQQKAYDIDQARKYKASKGKEGLDIIDADDAGEADNETIE